MILLAFKTGCFVVWLAADVASWRFLAVLICG